MENSEEWIYNMGDIVKRSNTHFTGVLEEEENGGGVEIILRK